MPLQTPAFFCQPQHNNVRYSRGSYCKDPSSEEEASGRWQQLHPLFFSLKQRAEATHGPLTDSPLRRLPYFGQQQPISSATIQSKWALQSSCRSALLALPTADSPPVSQSFAEPMPTPFPARRTSGGLRWHRANIPYWCCHGSRKFPKHDEKIVSSILCLISHWLCGYIFWYSNMYWYTIYLSLSSLFRSSAQMVILAYPNWQVNSTKFISASFKKSDQLAHTRSK
jgi:hypothetical protein